MALKYALDAGAIYFGEGRILDPIRFMSPLIGTRANLVGKEEWVLVPMMLWALLFLWIGVAMSVRRAVDAGWSPWIGMLFVLPLVNLLLIAALCLAPSHPRAWDHPAVAPSKADQVKSAMIGIALGLAIAALMFG